MTWTAPPPVWTQANPNDIRTVDILVFNRSTQVPLKWNYTLSPGSNLLTTTFSIDNGVSNDIGVVYHKSDDIIIFDRYDYRTRFNISRSEVATLIISKATEREEASFLSKLSTSSNTWVYKIRVKLTGKKINNLADTDLVHIFKFPLLQARELRAWLVGAHYKEIAYDLSPQIVGI